MANHRTQLQTQPAMRRQQGITGHLWAHLAVTQDEMRQDGEHGFARRALDTPDGESTQVETGIVGVARVAPAPAEAGTVEAVQPVKVQKSEHQPDEYLRGCQEL